jgi:hypothetical protein
MEELKKLLGADKAKEYDKTIVALNSGMEIGVSDTLISGFNQEFTSLGMDLMSLDKNQQVSAPDVYKRFGFDYIISRDTASNQYFVKFQFPRIVNGKTMQDSEILYVPINSSISTIQDAITSKMLQIHTGNQQVLQQQRMSSNFMNPQGAPAQDWNTVKQQITQ